jgi:regulator of RNase E activity RraA
VAWGGSVTVGGVRIDHGDYVVADSTGMVFVPAPAAGAVLAAAEEIAAVEARMASALDGGAPVSEVMGRSYETMLERPPA